MPQAPQAFPVIGITEIVSRTFNFARGLGVGETVVSGVCTISVISGTDSTPQARFLDGVVAITSPLASITIGGMLDQVIYRVQVDVTTSEGQVLSLWAIQPCSAP